MFLLTSGWVVVEEVMSAWDRLEADRLIVSLVFFGFTFFNLLKQESNPFL